MMSGKTVKIILTGVGLGLLGIALALISCSKDGSSPVTPQVNGGAANFYAEDNASCEKPYGAYYQDGDGEFSLKICEPGDYQIEYQTDEGVTYYLWVRVKKSTILHLGLYSAGQEPVNLVKACVRKGVISLEDSAMNVSGPVRYYPKGGTAIPDEPAIFESDGSSKICMIEDGVVNVGSQIDELPAPRHGSGGGGPVNNVTCANDGGTTVAGSTACWFLGIAGKNCTAVCGANANFTAYNGATATFAGGSLANCYTVLDGLAPTSGEGGDVGSGNCGCVLASDSKGYRYPTTDETCTPTDPDEQRVCACMLP